MCVCVRAWVRVCVLWVGECEIFERCCIQTLTVVISKCFDFVVVDNVRRRELAILLRGITLRKYYYYYESFPLYSYPAAAEKIEENLKQQ